MRTRDQAWRALRGLRARPPGMAASDEARRHVFTAALEQGQQLMEAAAVTGYATRPILAFYGLSQLGRSIAAASCHLRDTSPAGNEAWRPSGHGITAPGLRRSAQIGLESITVKGHLRGALPVVAQALGSPVLPPDQEIPLMSLWAMLPEGQQVPPPGVVGKPAILAHRLHLDGGRVDPSTYSGGPVIATTRLVLREIPEASRGARWEDYIAWFPGLQNPRPPDQHALRPQGILEATWKTNWRDFEESTYEWKTGLDDTFVHPHIPVTRYRGIECAIPLLPGMNDPLHPLTIWWPVLYTLSMLARYEPDTWADLTDVNTSDAANAIEHLLDTALDVVPELALAAINDSIQQEPG